MCVSRSVLVHRDKTHRGKERNVRKFACEKDFPWQRVTCVLFLFFLGLMLAGFGMAANQPVNKTSTCAYTFRGTKYQYKLMSCCDQRKYKCNDEMFKDCTRPLPSCEEYKSVLGTAALMILSGIIGSVVSYTGSGDGDGELKWPRDVAVLPSNQIAIVAFGNHCICIFDGRYRAADDHAP